MEDPQLARGADEPEEWDVFLTEKGFNDALKALRRFGREAPDLLSAAYEAFDEHAEEYAAWKQRRIDRKLSARLDANTGLSMYKKVGLSYSKSSKEINYHGSAYTELVQRLRQRLASGGVSKVCSFISELELALTSLKT